MQKTLTNLVLCTLFPLFSFAQVSSECVGSIPPTLATVANPIVCMGSINVSLVTSSNLTKTEYVLTDKNTTAADGLGPVILGTSESTTIDPVAEGVTTGMTFEVTAVSYNLTQIQNLIDDLYNNQFIFTPCCTIADAAQPGLCDDLMAAGVNSGADIQNLEDALNVFNTINGSAGTSSIAGLVGQIDQVNTDAAALPGVCGGSNLPLCYAVDQGATNTFNYQPVPSIDVITDGCPGAPETITVMASVTAGTLEYSTDGITYQMSNVLTAVSNPTMIFVQETTCGQVSSTSYNSSCALPVDLIAFSGKVAQRNHLLTWRTASTENFDQFSLEQSLNGLAFAELATIAPKPAAAFNNYQYTAIAASNTTHYYRLKMLDRDGAFSYSKVISLVTQADNQITLFPNPVRAMLFVTVESDTKQLAQASVYDAAGRLIVAQAIPLELGSTQAPISTQDWASGLYFLRLEMKDAILTNKFVVDK